jgi:hypothetical protein
MGEVVVGIIGVNLSEGSSVPPSVADDRTIFIEEALLIDSASRTIKEATLNGFSIENSAVIVGVDTLVDDWKERFFKNVLADGPVGASPIEFPFTSPNALSARLSIRFGIKGEISTITSGALSFLKALIYSAELVSSGISDGVLVGGVSKGKAITLYLGRGSGDIIIDDFCERKSDGVLLNSIEESFSSFINALEDACSSEDATSVRHVFNDKYGNSVLFSIK